MVRLPELRTVFADPEEIKVSNVKLGANKNNKKTQAKAKFFMLLTDLIIIIQLFL